MKKVCKVVTVLRRLDLTSVDIRNTTRTADEFNLFKT